MPASGIKLLDANVWLALAADGHSHHSAAKTWFHAQADQSCAICRITQLALLRHLTNSKIMAENVQTQVESWKVCDVLLSDSRVVFLDEPANLEFEFRQLTQGKTPQHRVWTDAYLAAFSRAGGCTMVTFDDGFRRFAGLDLLLLVS